MLPLLGIFIFFLGVTSPVWSELDLQPTTTVIELNEQLPEEMEEELEDNFENEMYSYHYTYICPRLENNLISINPNQTLPSYLADPHVPPNNLV